MTHFDVAVIGAGPAGLATARAILRCGSASVLIVDAHSAKRLRVGESAPPDLLVPLGRLGLQKRFRNDGHAPCPGSSAL